MCSLRMKCFCFSEHFWSMVFEHEDAEPMDMESQLYSFMIHIPLYYWWKFKTVYKLPWGPKREIFWQISLECTDELGIHPAQCFNDVLFYCIPVNTCPSYNCMEFWVKAMLNTDSILKAVIVLGLKNNPALILDITWTHLFTLLPC